MTKTKTVKITPIKKSIPNWLVEPIQSHILLGIGFERTKKDKKYDDCLRSCQSNICITNFSTIVNEAYYYQPLDAVAYRIDDYWHLALDRNFDHVWQGKLQNMSDLLQVLIGLSK